MNTPNKLTLLRVILAPVFMVFFIADNFWMKVVALALFTVAALTDLADGYYARKFGIITGFGKFMDPLGKQRRSSQVSENGVFHDGCLHPCIGVRARSRPSTARSLWCCAVLAYAQ